MNATLTEEILCSMVHYLPYVMFILYAFHSDLKISKKCAWGIIVLASLVEVLCWVLVPTPNSHTTQIFSVFLTGGSFLLYIAVADINFFHATFRLLVVNNVANFIVVASKFMEGKLFPEHAIQLSHWTYSLCTVILQILILGSGALYLGNHRYKKFGDGVNPGIWKSLCLIPSVFYIIWHYVLYHIPDKSSLEMALNPSHMVLQVAVLGGQFLIYMCVYQLVYTYNQLIELGEENNQLSMQTVQYNSIQKQINEVRIMRHDIRHHMQLLCEYAENGQMEELKRYLRKYREQTSNETKISYCENITLNMLLAYYSILCEKNEIEFDVKMSIPTEWALTDSETAVVFGNILENACDACRQQISGRRKISVFGSDKNGYVFTVDNTCTNKVIRGSQNHFLSTKHSGYGLGTASAENIVTKHHGTIRFDPRDGMFCVSIQLPKSEPAAK